MDLPYRVRPAVIEDIPHLVAYRRAMFQSMGIVDQATLDSMCQAMTRYLTRAMPGGDYLGWVAEAGDGVIASGGLVIHTLPPGPRNMDGREGYIVNIYTVPEWRRLGVATAIVGAILAHLKSIGVPVATLHATPAGRLMYERLGFQATNEMRVILDRAQRLL